MGKCSHVILRFSTGGLYVTCARCGWRWLSVKPDGSVNAEARESGLGGDDIRVVPELRNKEVR